MVLRTRVIYFFLYLYIYFWQILCWPFFCVIRTCEGKLCGEFICFRIFEKKNYVEHLFVLEFSRRKMGVHQAATRLTHQLLPAVAQQCILGRQLNQSHRVWRRAALVFGEVITVFYAQNMLHPPPCGMIPGYLGCSSRIILQIFGNRRGSR